MRKIRTTICIIVLLITVSLRQQAQVLDVSIINTGDNKLQITGTATGEGFTADTNNNWSSMNLTWRIPKSAANPSPTVSPGSATPEVTGEATEFTGAAPRDGFTGTLDLSVFDLTAFGAFDDGNWYFQVTGTAGNVQNIAAGDTIVLYEFTLPAGWSCAACAEILTSDVPGIPIGTTSFIDNASMGTNVMNLAVNNAPLPVTFISFEAHKNNAKVQLKWRVSNEENIYRYYVERSNDGITYTGIGFVNPQPAAIFNDYTFTDETPGEKVNYYRIREEDLDGRSVYSVTRTVRMQEHTFSVLLYPVPANDLLNIRVNAAENAKAVIRITDVLGRTLFKRNIQLKEGENREKIPVQEFKNGVYFIEVFGTGKYWTGKFVKE